MLDFLRQLFSTEFFMPHGVCMRWAPEIVWLHIISDIIIAVSYYSIPVVLFYYVRKRKDQEFRWVFIMFGLFILTCGTTHVMEIITLYSPVYRFEGIVKLVCALISIATAVALWPLLPLALAIPTPTQLEAVNRELEREIQARQEAAEELRILNAELEHRVEERTAELMRTNEDLQQFAYVASHDLQEPLRMVTTHIQLLERSAGEKLSDDEKEYISTAVKGSKRMKSLIDDLLVYSRLNSEEERMEEVSLQEPLEDAIDNLAQSIKESEAEVTHDQKLPQVTVNRVQLSQVFQNLIGNAIKYSGDKKPQVHVGVERREDAWLISVSDQGVGVDPRFTEKIFDIFQRLHQRDRHPGNGIGLSVCKKIIERHGGRIWVEKKPAGEPGAEFRFTIPTRKG